MKILKLFFWLLIFTVALADWCFDRGGELQLERRPAADNINEISNLQGN